MPNDIKKTDDTPALQVTREARSADLAEESTDDDAEGSERWARLSDVRVYGFDGAVIVVDRERVDVDDVAELVATAARDTNSIYQGRDGSVRVAGNGCLVSLPGLEDTGIAVGDTAPAHPAPNMLVITEDTRDGSRLAEDLKTIRREQVGPDDSPLKDQT